MRSTRVHSVGRAILVVTVIVWLLLTARLSDDPATTIPLPEPASESAPAATVPATLPDDAIRDLRSAAERAARDTLLTKSPPKAAR